MTESKPDGHPALTDQLTGLPNQLHFDTVYRVVFAAVDRGIPVSVAAMEIDDMDKLRVARGEHELPELERRMARQLQRTTRTSDLLARVGEGRYLMLLFDCNPHGARIAADRFQDTAYLEGDADVTVSLGMATTVRGEVAEATELVKAARDALDRAKALGPGSVELYTGAMG